MAGKRVQVKRGRAVVDLRGMKKGTVKVKVTVKRKGKTVRETRVYKTCTPPRTNLKGPGPFRFYSTVMTMRPAPLAGNIEPRSRHRRGP